MNKLLNRQSGAVAILVALLLPVLIGFLALAIDVGYMFLMKNKLQVAADSAALVAAGSIQHGQGIDVAHAWALTATTANGFTNGIDSTTVTISIPPGGTDSYAEDANYVKVTVQHETSTFLAGIFGVASTLTSASAVSGPAGEGNPCLLTLGSSGSNAIFANGNVTITTNNCGIFVNSNNDTAMNCKGNANNFVANSISVVGRISEKCITSESSSVKTETSTTIDPFVKFPLPASTACSGGSIPNTKNINLSPGVYCGGISIPSGHIVTMDAVVYVMNGGGFSIGGSTSISGSGITIYNSGTGTSGLTAYGNINFTGTSDVNLSAPSTGAYAGMLFFQNPSNTKDASLGGNSQVILKGNLYFPTSTLTLSGSNTTNIPIGSVVAQQITFQAGTKFKVTNTYGASGSTSTRSALYQ